MKFTLIVCTYMRPQPLLTLLKSVSEQLLYPDEILIVDGSTNEETKEILEKYSFTNLKYYLVPDQERGLTKQRNFGIERVNSASDVICFLDDDTVLEKEYFSEIFKAYQKFPDAAGIGGYITNEVVWETAGIHYTPKINEYFFDGWKRKDGSRFVWRKRLGLDSDKNPGYLPEFSHGRSVGFLPPSGKIYQVEQLMGGVSSFKKSVFEEMKFSTYFEGYGLYEDADFTLRLSKSKALYVATSARLAHYHDASGRPNKFAYGKMVVRNGWYVWRVKHPQPSVKSILKWHSITLLLTIIRGTNVITTKKRKEAFTETMGRLFGWFSLFVDSPKLG
ncbi:glycosyltransferase family 2 protein [Flavobacterium sp.]|uniref:glycosyltransferase family 2 protein n=1 Tax=Flavobacterium sp. TaxID=239 RepID=UPI0028BEE69B|nr:glycosyltransferase family 2 protein [Flavobacterium sp.]